MGMSASQARLISLTARMSDTEYEAQQINQQRLTLSNKMNEVQEAAINMDVPTAPAKIDYMHKVYHGATSTGQVIKVSQDKNGSFVIERKAQGETVDYASNLTKKETKIQDFTALDVKPATRTTTQTISYDEKNSDEYKAHVLKVNNIKPEEVGENKSYYWQGGLLLDKEGNSVNGVDDPDNAENEIPMTYSNDYTNEDAYSDTQIAELVGKVWIDDGSGARLLKESDFKADGTCGYTFYEETPEGKKADAHLSVTLENDSYSGFSVMSFDEAYKKYADNETYKTMLDELQRGIRNSFPDNKLDEFSVLVDSKGNFRVCFTDDAEDTDGTVRSYQFNKDGIYWDKATDVNQDSITHDTNGNISTIQVGKETVLLTVENVTDEDKYAAAMAKYESDKATYDQEQNKLNKQTSIYQRQDKQLELKLTRLDSERNALNTEIEAVKKVIQDSIDKGFKTFSG